MGTVPATPGCENAPVDRLHRPCGHVARHERQGCQVPASIEEYDGGDIALNGQLTMRVADFPELEFFKGHTLIHTDGTTLLGADDKAGVAEIMTAAEYLLAHPEIKHGKIRIGFTPDEEVGRGVDFFDVKAFGADFAYTVDGGMEGELEYENFNAASAKIDIQGRNVHPGYAKDKMINAIEVACDLQRLASGLPSVPNIPKVTRDSTTAWDFERHGREALRDQLHHPRPRRRQSSNRRRVYHVERCVDLLKKKYGDGVLTLTAQRPVLQHAQDGRAASAGDRQGARSDANAPASKPLVRPIRGGTDGARLSFMGLPCPNLFTGGMNFHGKFEYCSLTTMRKAQQVILNLAQLWAE